MKIMAFGPITSWQIDGETMETVRDFIFGSSKTTGNDDCSHEIKRCLLVWRKVMTSLAAFLKAEILLCWKSSVQTKLWFFPVVIYGCESWSIKNGEKWRTEGFELWCWTRLLRVPRTTRRSNKSMLKEINLEYSLEGSMLELKLQYLGQLMWRTYSLEKTLLLGTIEGRRRGGWQRMRWLLDGITDSMTWVWARSRSWWRTEKPGVLQSMGLQRVRHDWATELNIPHGKC